MWTWLALTLGLITGVAHAEAPEVGAAEVYEVEGPFGGGNPIEDAKNNMEEKKDEKQLAQEERQKAFEDAQKGRQPRVVILKWPESDADYENEGVQRNVINRISRPDAKFYPEIDLYQAGRKEPDRAVLPQNQRAMVPDDASDRIMDKVEEISSVPWDAFDEQTWGQQAHQMRELANELWFLDRPELREPLFLLYSQIGRAADSSGEGSPPFFEQVGGTTVNYYWYLAAAMATETPELLSLITVQDLNASISYYRTLLDSGTIGSMTLSFEVEGKKFNGGKFAGEYTVFINGVETLITDPNGLLQVPPGRVDVYFARSDGHSLSDAIEIDKLDEKIYFVREVARKKMGLDFQYQLMDHPNECIPPVDGDILNYLSIYQKLHPASEVYIGVANAGRINKILLWRWVPEQAVLQRVLDDTLGFPVRFAAAFGTGMTFDKGTVSKPPSAEDVASAQQGAAESGGGQPDLSAGTNYDPTPTLNPAGLPIAYHLRAHFNRLMLDFGMEWSKALVDRNGNKDDGAQWTDLYQTNLKDGPEHQLSEQSEEIPCGADADGDGVGDDVCSGEAWVRRDRDFQRLTSLGIGVMFGRNATDGFGPYVYVRTGWTNVPHAIDLTGHLGWSTWAPWVPGPEGRVNPLLNVDLFAGVGIPFGDSMFLGDPSDSKLSGGGKGGSYLAPNGWSKPGNKLGKPLPTFGTTLMAGTTF